MLSKALNYFPYDPRFNQKRVIKKLYLELIDGKSVFFNAPTGYGKTPVVLSSALPIAEELGLKIIWTVRTGNETDRPIEELVNVSKKIGRWIFGLSLRGKRDMCLLARERNINDHEGVSVICQRFRKKCPYYHNLSLSHITFTKPLIFSETLNYATKNNVCPYFLQYRLLRKATVISMSYNYVFSRAISWSVRSYIDLRETILIVDEAHNMQNVISSLYSDKITINTVDRAINELNEFKDPNSIKLARKLKYIRSKLIEEANNLHGEDDLFDIEKIFEGSSINDDDIDHARKVISKIYSRKLKEGKSPRSSLRHLIDFLVTSIDLIGIQGIVFLKYKDKNRIVFERWDMRASEYLRDVWKQFYSIVFMSGTLKPYKAFSDVIGLNEYVALSDRFDIPKRNVVSLIVKDLNTKGEKLSGNMREKYIEALKIILPELEFNTAIFFASYRIMNELIDELIDIAKEHGKNIYVESEGMKGEEAKQVLEHFKKTSNNILLASMQGRFAEGADFPGEALECIVLIGIPFERLTMRTKLYIKYYSELYGSTKGKFYAYILPALKRASQSMGRAIRGPNDKALIIAMDERYRDNRYFKLLPYFFKESAKLVNVPAALDFINDFKKTRIS